MGLHIALHDRFLVSLQSLHDLSKRVEVRYIFECYNSCSYCGEVLNISSYPKCYFNSLNILWINKTVCGGRRTGMAEIIFGWLLNWLSIRREFTLQ